MARSILAAIDGSPQASRALAVAAGIATRHHAPLTVLTAARRSEDAAAARLLEEATTAVSGPPVTARIAIGQPAAAIIEEAETGAHDLVVVGSRGRGAVASTLLGSVTRSVVGTCPAPVLVLRGDDDAAVAAGPFRSILVAIDESSSCRFALEQAVDLARVDGARLTVMTAVNLRRVLGQPESARVRIQLDLAEHAQAFLDDAMWDIPDDVPVDTLMTLGGVEAAILAEIESGRHDLLVLGSRGLSPLRATLLGSVGLAMLWRCPVSVLIARPPAGSDGTGTESGSDAEATAIARTER
jgi:nucleotide-binding universal stress UspA family protein